MGQHSSVAGALAASGTTNATGIGYKTIYNQQRPVGNELKPPGAPIPNNGGLNNKQSPRVGRVRADSSSRDKATPGSKSGSQGNAQ